MKRTVSAAADTQAAAIISPLVKPPEKSKPSRRVTANIITILAASEIH